jgi:hypothetical protein
VGGGGNVAEFKVDGVAINVDCVVATSVSVRPGIRNQAETPTRTRTPTAMAMAVPPEIPLSPDPTGSTPGIQFLRPT